MFSIYFRISFNTLTKKQCTRPLISIQKCDYFNTGNNKKITGHNNDDLAYNGIKIWEFKKLPKKKQIQKSAFYIFNDDNRNKNVDSKEWKMTLTRDELKEPELDHVKFASSSKASMIPLSQKKVKQMIRDAMSHILPHDYPNSVPPSYSSFAIYQFIASTSSSAFMVLSTQTLLHAIGLSSQTAAPISAALNWVIKDGVGQLGGIIFASSLGKSSKGLDAYPKQWRMLSNVALDLSTFIEIISPMFSYAYFLPLASLANVGKNISFLSASASRATLHQSLALKANLADVTAKAGSQSILASLIGTTLGVGMSPFLITGQDYHSSYVLITTCFILSAIHQGGTYMSLRCVPLLHFNQIRLHYILKHFVFQYLQTHIQTQPRQTKWKNNNNQSKTKKDDSEIDKSNLVLSPIEVAHLEPIAFHTSLPSLYKSNTVLSNPNTWLTVGCSLEDLCPHVNDFTHLILNNEKYIINCLQHDSEREMDDTSDGYKVNLIFHYDAKDMDLLRGMLHAYNLRKCLEHNDDKMDNEIAINAISKSYQIMESSISLLEQGLTSQGWIMNVDQTLFNCDDGAYHMMQIECNR